VPLAVARKELAATPAFSRAAQLMGLASRMDSIYWLRLVGEFWAVTDGDRRALTGHLLSLDDWHPMMNKAERMEWSALPVTFTAWRGCYEGFNEGGLSFHLDRDTARSFPFMARYRIAGGVPVLLRVQVRREHCIVKLDHGESEIVARCVEVLRKVTQGYGKGDGWL